MPSKLGRILQRVHGFVQGDGRDDSAVYLQDHQLVVDLIGNSEAVDGLLVRRLAPGTNAPTTIFQLQKDGVLAVPLGIREVSVNLTNAEILTLSSVGKEILPAPGAGKRYIIVLWHIALDNAAALYTSGSASVYLSLTGAGGVSISGTIGNAFFTAGASVKLQEAIGGGSSNAQTDAMVNAPLTLTMTGDFTGGDAANKATVTVVYRIADAAPE